MELSEFDRQARQDPQISALMQEVAAEIGHIMQTEETNRYVVGVDDLVIGLAALALYGWINDIRHHQRAENETKIVERRVRVIQWLIGMGFEPEKAAAVAEGLYKQVAKRTEDDPAVNKALALLGNGGS